MRPIINVKKPLMLDKMVALATLVKPRDAFIVQFARNQRKQNTDARWAVSRVVRGDRAAEVDAGGMEDEWRRGLVLGGVSSSFTSGSYSSEVPNSTVWLEPP